MNEKTAVIRQPGLDLLRALAIVLVVVYHVGLFGFTLPYRIDRFGWIGVDLFFVLSGYLIGGQLLSALARQQPIQFGRFYWRRALRILPAFLVVVAIYFFLPTLREYPSMPPLWKFLSFTQNLGLRGGTAFSHAWSLCVEAQFYLLLPLILLVISRARGWQVAIPVIIILVGIAIRASFAYLIDHPPQFPIGTWQQLIYYATYARLDPLLMGVSLAAIQIFRASWWARLENWSRWIWLPALAAIVLALFLAESDWDVVNAAFAFPLIAFGCAAFLICAVSSKLSISRKPIPGAAFLAMIAYSIYLSHKLVIHWAEGFCDAHALSRTSLVGYIIVLTGITIVGSLLFVAVERPFLKIRQRH